MENLIRLDNRAALLRERLRYQLILAETNPMPPSVMQTAFSSLEKESRLFLDELRQVSSSRQGWELWRKWRQPLEEVRVQARQAAQGIAALTS